MSDELFKQMKSCKFAKFIIIKNIRKLLKYFYHGQLYLAMSRIENSSGISIMTKRTLKNVLLKMMLVQILYRIRNNF